MTPQAYLTEIKAKLVASSSVGSIIVVEERFLGRGNDIHGLADGLLVALQDRPIRLVLEDMIRIWRAALSTVMVAGNVRLKVIVPPAAAAAISARNEPAPLSSLFVTTWAMAEMVKTSIKPQAISQVKNDLPR